MIEFTKDTDGAFAAGERHTFEPGIEDAYILRGVAVSVPESPQIKDKLVRKDRTFVKTK